MKNLIYLAFAIALVFSSCSRDVSGCTDPLATNFEADANVDDGNCVYAEEIRGCTNPNSDNYNPNATIDDGSCIVLGCTDPEAENYNPNATQDDGSCIDKREKFLGDWRVDSDCGFAFPLANLTTIAIRGNTSNQVTLNPLTLTGDSAYAVIDGLGISFPDQVAGGGFIQIDYSGDGVMNSTYTEFTVDFTYTSFFGGQETCTATYTKQ